MSIWTLRARCYLRSAALANPSIVAGVGVARQLGVSFLTPSPHRQGTIQLQPRPVCVSPNPADYIADHEVPRIRRINSVVKTGEDGTWLVKD